MKRNAYRGTSFNLPCNRKFWKKCGDFDSLIQFQECAYRALMNDLSNKQKADSALVLDNYMKLLSANSSLKFEIMAKQLYVASQRVL